MNHMGCYPGGSSIVRQTWCSLAHQVHSSVTNDHSSLISTLALTAVGTAYAVYWPHYSDVIIGTMESQITSLTIVYATVYSGADQRKHHTSASLAFMRGIHRSPVNSPNKWPETWKMFPFDDVIMSWAYFYKRVLYSYEQWTTLQRLEIYYTRKMTSTYRMCHLNWVLPSVIHVARPPTLSQCLIFFIISSCISQIWLFLFQYLHVVFSL